MAKHPLNSPDADEDADLTEMLGLNKEIERLLDRRKILAAKITARYTQGSLSDNEPKGGPAFDDSRQRHAFDYLRTIGGRTVMKPMAAYVQGKGCDLGTSSKPGVRLAPELRKRDDVFGYDAKTEEWFLHPPEKWRQEQKKTGA